jgi:hypothetical protein
VRPGDDQWSIAAAHLAVATARPVAGIDVDEVAGYWARVCETNRHRLRSGDVSVVFAGEVVTLPPVDGR